MRGDEILEINIQNYDRKDILVETLKYIKKPRGSFHIVSLNPEIFTLINEHPDYAETVREAQIRIVDGVGVVLAGRILGIGPIHRVTGVELMLDLLELANKGSFRVVLIGGGPKIAEEVVECQKQRFPEAKLFGIEGIHDINNPTEDEEKKLFTIIADRKPHLVFVAFGSPEQELWLYRNRHKFEATVCMGVGGTFDFLSGHVHRAPKLIRSIGLEWLFRLVLQPWRWKRQLRLLQFSGLILKQKFQGASK